MSYTALINELRFLMSNDKLRRAVDKRVMEFVSFNRRDKQRVFSELSFCILTANFNAKGAMKIQSSVDFFNVSASDLRQKLKQLGHRFPNKRAEFIIEARKKIDDIVDVINATIPTEEKREWLVKNIKGIGYKEASHFLRNIGFLDLAIIDFHIVDVLIKYRVVEERKSLTKSRYIEIENKLKEISKAINLPLGELDLYLWYMETGNILK